ncbi:hypothetical protein I546_2387 [Mycobacterium kansasii 732]|nr:hypothetical protein I546_2387 [Mycobacterium kansasii 732]
MGVTLDEFHSVDMPKRTIEIVQRHSVPNVILDALNRQATDLGK